MRKLISIILLFLPLFAHAQTEVTTTEEVVISPEFIYGISSIYIKANEDASFQYSVDLDKNNTFLTGKVTSLEPMVRTGKYTFNTPGGKPYASGFYSNNIQVYGYGAIWMVKVRFPIGELFRWIDS